MEQKEGELIMIPNELKEFINELTAVALEYDASTDIEFVNGNIKISIKPRSYYES